MRTVIPVVEDVVVVAVDAAVGDVEEVAEADVEDAAADRINKNDTMKNNKHTGLYLIAGLALLLPFLYIHTWNPFSVKGPLFLSFYMLLMLIVYADIVLLNWYLTGKGDTLRYAGLITGAILVLGVARVIQGLYNAKPVGYLVLLLLLHLAISGLMGRRKIAS